MSGYNDFKCDRFNHHDIRSTCREVMFRSYDTGTAIHLDKKRFLSMRATKSKIIPEDPNPYKILVKSRVFFVK